MRLFFFCLLVLFCFFWPFQNILVKFTFAKIFLSCCFRKILNFCYIYFSYPVSLLFFSIFSKFIQMVFLVLFYFCFCIIVSTTGWYWWWIYSSGILYSKFCHCVNNPANRQCYSSCPATQCVWSSSVVLHSHPGKQPRACIIWGMWGLYLLSTTC